MVQTRNLAQYAELHRTRRYGDTGIHKLKIIEPWVRIRRPGSIIDYGAGQSELVDHIMCSSLSVRTKYDPAIPRLARRALTTYDMALCTDVMEHIDEAEIPAILGDIKKVTKHAIFCIDTRPAATILPNGENAHATVRPPEWWLTTLKEHFPAAELICVRNSGAYFKTWTSRRKERLRAWAMRKLKI